MAIGLEQLRCFQIAAETLNFTKAAEHCFMTQPAFSRAIASLEAEWKLPLFERSTRKVRLTKEGEACLKKTAAVLRAYDGLNDTVENLRKTVYGELKLGFNQPSRPPGWFVSALKQFQAKYPAFSISVEQIASDRSIHKVLDGELDCALVYEHSVKNADRLQSRRLLRTYRYAVMRKDHPLAERASLSLEELRSQTLFFMKDLETHTYQRFHACCHHKELTMGEERIVQNMTELAIQVELSGGVGITGLAEPIHANPALALVPIRELNEPEEASYLALAWNRENRNPGISWLLELLERAILEQTPQEEE